MATYSILSLIFLFFISFFSFFFSLFFFPLGFLAIRLCSLSLFFFLRSFSLLHCHPLPSRNSTFSVSIYNTCWIGGLATSMNVDVVLPSFHAPLATKKPLQHAPPQSQPKISLSVRLLWPTQAFLDSYLEPFP